MKLTRIILYFAILSACRDSSEHKITAKSDTKLFTLLDASHTGIDFINRVNDTESFNILTYRNFYNGGGVSIGDVNNDSLPDIYLTANQLQNKLYLNKGNFQFEDITEKAGVGGNKPWSAGTVMADVNGDGLLDIYVCNSGDVDGADLENELFINNGNLTFTEKAKEYNLDNKGYSTHAAFFDYDIDGDLDCYILNNSFKDPGKIELYKKIRELSVYERGDKLMRNDGSHFTDVTKESGIFSSEIGFGLGVAIADLNNDELPDIYISNDFWERDYLYINQGEGKFSEELVQRINYCSVSSMGADVADLNNDGSPEIFTTDMLPGDNYHLKTAVGFDPYHLEDLKYRANFHYQMIQNCLHLNDGNGMFQEIALLSDVSATDWSWGALIFDFENDGNKDIFVSNGIAKDVMSLDFRDFLSDQERKASGPTDKLDYLRIISRMPSRPLRNFAFSNKDDLRFVNEAASLGFLQTGFSNGSAYGDLDNDGDLDLVVNNVNQESSIYRNETDNIKSNNYLKIKFKGYSGNPFGIGAKVVATAKDTIRVLENFNSRGFQSSVEPQLLFGLKNTNVINNLKIIWPDKKVQEMHNVKSNQTIVFDHANAVQESSSKPKIDPMYKNIASRTIHGDGRHYENRFNDFDQEVLLTNMLSTEGPRLVTGDVNNDNLDDFVLLGAKGSPDKLFIQNKDYSFNLKSVNAFTDDKDFESTCGAFLDYDSDGDLDLMVGSGGNEPAGGNVSFVVRAYKNDGKGNFRADPKNIPQCIGNFSTLEAEDFDADGDTDVFIGARAVPGNYGLQPRSYLFKKIDGVWVDVAKSSLSNIGMVTDANWVDIDSDTDLDLVVVGDWMPIHIFKNEFGALSEPIKIHGSNGWWTRVESADLDGDEDMDLILGNWGLNSKFKATQKRPVTMAVNDFDNNGKTEFIINWFPPIDSVAYPFATKQELTFQLPALRKSILKYEHYAQKTYDSLFKLDVKKTAVKYSVDYLQSAILWNEGKNKFTLKALPIEAQISPVFGIVADDLDGNGTMDIWLGGNFYGTKPQVGRYDASRGVLLSGQSNRTFKFVPNAKVGISVAGEIRDAALIETSKYKRILLARNNESLLLYEQTKK